MLINKYIWFIYLFFKMRGLRKNVFDETTKFTKKTVCCML